MQIAQTIFQLFTYNNFIKLLVPFHKFQLQNYFNKFMKPSDESITFLSRRSHRNNNHQQLHLSKISVAPILSDSKQPSSDIHTQQTNSKSLKLAQEQFRKQPFQKMNRFKDMVSSFHKIKDNIYGKDEQSFTEENSRREIFNRTARTSQSQRLSQEAKSYRSRVFSRQFRRDDDRVKSMRDNDNKQEHLLNQSTRYKNAALERITVKSSPMKRKKFDQSRFNEVKPAQDKKQKCKQASKASVEKTKNDQMEQFYHSVGELDHINNPEALTNILAEYGIANTKDLDEFLLENKFLQHQYENTSNNFGFMTKTPYTKYQKTYQPHTTGAANNSFQAHNYQCLAELHLKKADLKKYKTVNQQDYNQKHIDRQLNKPKVEDKKSDEISLSQQISYKTSYQFEFENPESIKIKSKQRELESFKPNMETLIHGVRFAGKTQYQKDCSWIQMFANKRKEQRARLEAKKTSNITEQSQKVQSEEMRLVKKIIMSESEQNKMRNGNSHNAIATKGFSVFSTTYSQHFATQQMPKAPQDQNLRKLKRDTFMQSDEKNNCNVSSLMYQTTTKKAFGMKEKIDTTKVIRKAIPPWKYHMLSELKALIELNKQKKSYLQTC